jgi:hypothetical protein
MTPDYQSRISSCQEKLDLLLKAPSIKYADWPQIDTKELRNAAGVYHFFQIDEGFLKSVYVGKAGFGRQMEKQTWSLHDRLSQHFLPSQKYALLTKASRKLGLSPKECKAQFLGSGLRLQWLTLYDNPTKRNGIESELLWFEYFAISVLRPEYTDR